MWLESSSGGGDQFWWCSMQGGEVTCLLPRIALQVWDCEYQVGNYREAHAEPACCRLARTF
jgi:hypothetical protein